MTRFQTLRSDAKQLAADARAYGDMELSAVADRVGRELNHPALTGAENTFGVNHSDVRK
jgi:hypothetical protein